MKLNLGCGRDVREGFVNVDQYPFPGVTVCNMDTDPLPFPDGSVESVLASHFLEHVLHFDRVMREIHRVLAPDGCLEVHVPYGLFGLENPYHRRAFTRRAVRQILSADNPDGVKTLEINERWKLIAYHVRHRIVPWLHKPKVGFDPWPWVYSAELTFVLGKVA